MNLDLVVFDIPLVGREIWIEILLGEIGEQIARHASLAHEVLTLVGLLHQLPAQAINGLALLVHHIVVFQQVLARFKVAAFDRLLRRRNAFGNHLGFNGHALFHAQTLHQCLDLVAGEDAHQIVFERKEKARRSGIALTAGATAQLIVDAARLVTFSAENVQATQRHDFFVFRFHDPFGLQVFLLPLRFSRFVGIDFLVFQELARHEIRISAEQDVGAATCHIRRDRDGAFAPGLGDDLGFTLVVFGVEHVMRNRDPLQSASDQFRVFHGNRADQHRLAMLVTLFDFFDDCVPFFRQSAIDHVRVVLADHRHVRGNYDHIKFVSRMKLSRFGFCRSSHAGKLFVKPEIVLQSDRGEGLILALDLHAFLGFDRLMQSVGPATAFHQTPGEVIDDNYLAILHHVLMIEPIKRVRLQGLLDAMQQFHVRRIVKVADAEQTLGFVHAFFREHG